MASTASGSTASPALSSGRIPISRYSTGCAASASPPRNSVVALANAAPATCSSTAAQRIVLGDDANAKGKSVVTLEGLGSISAPHPVQAAFIKEQVP